MRQRTLAEVETEISHMNSVAELVAWYSDYMLENFYGIGLQAQHMQRLANMSRLELFITGANEGFVAWDWETPTKAMGLFQARLNEVNHVRA